jgi:hypothetical protein
MADSPEPQAETTPRVTKEYEDPHYHDEDEVVPPPDDDVPHGTHVPAGKKLPRRLPPPRRRFTDD